MASEARRITDFSSPLFSEGLAILRDSISGNVQLPEQRLKPLLATGNYQCFALCDGDAAQGLALVYFSPNKQFAWLDYMTVRSDLRCRGLGTVLVREVLKEARARPDLSSLLLEVDDDREGNDEQRALKRRRIEFYRRLGCRLLKNVPYRFPSAVGAPIPMRLMACGLNGLIGDLSPADLKTAVAEIFANIHGRSRDDELMTWFERNLPEQIEFE